MNDVQYIPSTFGSQKCLVPINEIIKFNHIVGGAVRVASTKGTFICKIYPRCDFANCMATIENTVQVYEKRHKHIIKIPLSTANTELNITQLTPQPASHVIVTVVAASFKSVFALRNNEIPSRVKSLLTNKIFVQNSAINTSSYCPINDISKLLILETIPAGVPVLINSKTKINVVSIITKKWLHHQEEIASSTRLGGLDCVYGKLKELIIYRLPFLQDSSEGKDFPLPKGILLHGPPGCGKSSIIRKLCDEFELYLLTVTCSDLSSSQPGENEEKLRSIFHETIENARDNQTVLFLDGIDSICPKRGGHSHTDRLITCLFGLIDEVHETANLRLMIVAATSRPEDVDPALRKSGRIDREVYFSVPNGDQRLDILKVICQNMELDSQCDLKSVADFTPGYVGADLNLLRQDAAYLSQDRGYCTLNDWKTAMNNMRSSVMRQAQGNGEFRKVRWEEVGGLEEAKKCIRRSIEWPLKHPEAFQRFGIPGPKGVLLYGPPGCGKSLLVRAAATSCAASFHSISSAELFSPFVGDSEKMISSLFKRARLAAPAILFLDELDSMVGARSNSNNGRTAQLGVITALLQEMDGISPSHGVVVIGATNRPDRIDGALLRPGRFDSSVYIPNPDEKARLAILKAASRKMPLKSVNLDLIAKQTHLFSGADLECLVKQTGLSAMEDDFSAEYITQDNFAKGLIKVPSSLTAQQMKFYQDYNSGVTSIRHLKVESATNSI